VRRALQRPSRGDGLIRELLLTARDLWQTLPETDDERERTRIARAAFRMLHLANITAVTSHA
jgi:hypothetical protein